MQKVKKSNFNLLTLSVFFHLLSCFCSFYLDSCKGPNGYKEINYGLNFFSGGSVQASLITFIYFIYQLLKKSPSGYFDKVFDLIVINANIISIGIFTAAIMPLCGGGKPLTSTPGKDGPIRILFFEMNRKVFWGTYAIIGHYLTPILTIMYFVQRKISLARTYFERKGLFFYSLIHPFLYTVFIFCRPLIPGSENYPCGRSKYPYFFFDGMTRNDFRHIFGALVCITIVFFFVIAFGFSTLFFGGYSNNKLEKNVKNHVSPKKN